MTATDELRRLLDERGVGWTAPESYNGSYDYDTIVGKYWYHEYDGKLTVHGLTPKQAIAATLGSGTCREVYLLMATDIGDGREEVLGVYATEEAAMAAINENQFGYALHHVRKWEMD